MGKSLPRVPIGWCVEGPTTNKYDEPVIAPISGVFNIRSSAEEFLALAVRGRKDADRFNIATVTKIDRRTNTLL